MNKFKPRFKFIHGTRCSWRSHKSKKASKKESPSRRRGSAACDAHKGAVSGQGGGDAFSLCLLLFDNKRRLNAGGIQILRAAPGEAGSTSLGRKR